MEVIRKNVVFKFTDEDILAIQRTRDIIDRMTENMCYGKDQIRLDCKSYVTEYLAEEIYSFLCDFTVQLLESDSKTIEVTKIK